MYVLYCTYMFVFIKPDIGVAKMQEVYKVILYIDITVPE